MNDFNPLVRRVGRGVDEGCRIRQRGGEGEPTGRYGVEGERRNFEDWVGGEGSREDSAFAARGNVLEPSGEGDVVCSQFSTPRFRIPKKQDVLRQVWEVVLKVQEDPVNCLLVPLLVIFSGRWVETLILEFKGFVGYPIDVTYGLQGGERVITVGQNKLRRGARIAIDETAAF